MGLAADAGGTEPKPFVDLHVADIVGLAASLGA
jgi:hypothetical protein